jgi:hypothetical protein
VTRPSETEPHAAPKLREPAAVMDIKYTAGEHYYLSTSCFHGVHEHCRSAVNIYGNPKEPGTCKWCPAVCICRCHHEEQGDNR